MLPLSDRVLLKLQAGEATARRLSRELNADRSHLYGILQALSAQGLVERVLVPKEAAEWRLAPGVRVRVEPARLIVEGAKPPTAPPEPATPAAAVATCRAVTTLGRPCPRPAGPGGLCVRLHAPLPNAFDEGGVAA